MAQMQGQILPCYSCYTSSLTKSYSEDSKTAFGLSTPPESMNWRMLNPQKFQDHFMQDHLRVKETAREDKSNCKQKTANKNPERTIS